MGMDAAHSCFGAMLVLLATERLLSSYTSVYRSGLLKEHAPRWDYFRNFFTRDKMYTSGMTNLDIRKYQTIAATMENLPMPNNSMAEIPAQNREKVLSRAISCCCCRVSANCLRMKSSCHCMPIAFLS
eukprot:CAMPEP_0204291442 /NCGR_PEP_ID=MMETSP0468-20130131/62536_1 /ASSEMBLY_ACC=CAM_ASM_000383 /TAXON_ID=2969 /ORGANISM="Oxyrrhis marina" /LENGTH=127 /DNA_ID=CAMNT_0051269739 /DNA_START=68 /DNA_END=451 /DNA_ORIENTATION=-